MSQALARRPKDESAREERREQVRVPAEPRVYYKFKGLKFRYGPSEADPRYRWVLLKAYFPKEYFIEVPRLLLVEETLKGLSKEFLPSGVRGGYWSDGSVLEDSKLVFGSNDPSLILKTVDEVVRILEENRREKTVYVVFYDVQGGKRILDNAFVYEPATDWARFSRAPWIEPIGYAYLPPRYVVCAYASIFDPYVIDMRRSYMVLPYTEEIVERVAEVLGEYHMRSESELENLVRELEGLRSTVQRRSEERRGDLVKVKMVLYRLPSEAIRGISSEVASELRSLRKDLNEALHRHGYRVFDIWVLRSDVDPAEFARSVVNEINSRIEYLRKRKGLKTEPGDHVILVDAWLPRGVLIAELKRYLEERREVLRDISQREQEATGARRRALAHERAQLEEEVRKLEEELKRLEGGEL
jgi:hypothetical protein